MSGTRRNQNAVADTDLTKLSIDLHAPLALEQKVELFACAMVVPLGAGTRRQTCFRKALVLDRGIRAVQNAPDR